MLRRGADVGRSVAAGCGRVPPWSGSEPTVLFDSGIRSGADVYKALALGADAVTLGRPHVYGLALHGRAGVLEVVRNVVAELDLMMGLTGCRTLADVDRARLTTARQVG